MKCPRCSIDVIGGHNCIPDTETDHIIKQKNIDKTSHIGSAGVLIDDLMKQLNNNNIEALCICILTKDKEIHIGWDKDSKFLDRIGMATTLVQDIYEATKKEVS